MLKSARLILLWFVTFIATALGCADLLFRLAAVIYRTPLIKFDLAIAVGLSALAVTWALRLIYLYVSYSPAFIEAKKGFLTHKASNLILALGALLGLSVILTLGFYVQGYFWFLITPQIDSRPLTAMGAVLSALLLLSVNYHYRTTRR